MSCCNNIKRKKTNKYNKKRRKTINKINKNIYRLERCGVICRYVACVLNIMYEYVQYTKLFSSYC